MMYLFCVDEKNVIRISNHQIINVKLLYETIELLI